MAARTICLMARTKTERPYGPSTVLKTSLQEKLVLVLAITWSKSKLSAFGWVCNSLAFIQLSLSWALMHKHTPIAWPCCGVLTCMKRTAPTDALSRPVYILAVFALSSTTSSFKTVLCTIVTKQRRLICARKGFTKSNLGWQCKRLRPPSLRHMVMCS